MDSCILDIDVWANANFASCDFNDRRLTRRLVDYAKDVALRPDDKTPQQTQAWKDCKGAYRFMDNDKVAFSEIVRPHCQRTKQLATAGVWLSICDTTEISFRPRRTIEGLKPVGNGTGQGFYLHSSVLVADQTDEIVGLAGQELFYRIPARKKENTAKRKKRERESEVWGRLVDSIGPPQADATIIHVCDREADDYEFFCHLVANRCGGVVRASRLTRKVYAASPSQPDSNLAVTQSLQSIIDEASRLGTYELEVKANKKQPARTATVEIRCCEIWMPQPLASSPAVKQDGPKFIRMGVVDVREVNVKAGIEPLRWVLYTHEPVSSFEDGWRTISRYEKRPLVEDFHKAAKTGAKIDNRLFRTAARQERIVAILSIMAIRLLQMKSISRVEPDRSAREVAPSKWIKTLCEIQRQQFPNRESIYDPQTITTRDFIRSIAMLSGFLARKSDGEPGWLTIWRGVQELQLAMRVNHDQVTTKKRKTCG